MLIGRTDCQCERDHRMMVTTILCFPRPILHTREQHTTTIADEPYALATSQQQA